MLNVLELGLREKTYYVKRALFSFDRTGEVESLCGRLNFSPLYKPVENTQVYTLLEKTKKQHNKTLSFTLQKIRFHLAKDKVSPYER